MLFYLSPQRARGDHRIFRDQGRKFDIYTRRGSDATGSVHLDRLCFAAHTIKINQPEI